jgi:predicted extracellular nuclease
VTAEAGTPNLVGNAYIPNPSVMTIVMGNVTLVLRTEKMGEVGTTTIPNFTLVPGDNNFPMTGILNQTAVLQSLDDGGNGVVTMHIKGQSVTYNGVNLTYYEAALSAHELTLPMNVTQIVRDSLAPAS